MQRSRPRHGIGWWMAIAGRVVVLVTALSPVTLEAQRDGRLVSASTAEQRVVSPIPDLGWVYPDYIDWLERRSMLYQSQRLAPMVSGRGLQWQREFAEPQPRAVVRAASVWVLGYPGSVITRPGESVIATWADPQLWQAFDEIGIDLLHTGPVMRAGGIVRKHYTPTIDGWFDRISLEIDPDLGTEEEYRRMVAVAARTGGLIAGDLVPLHTGRGADFLLALRAYKNYVGMYTMVEIDEKDWPLLPPVDSAWATALIDNATATELMQRGYIPGRIQSADADPQVRGSSGWSATGEILGVDGRIRRWVYLHIFKPGQPTLNWLDPSCAAQQVVAGDLVRTIHDLGTQVVRLDAVPFLGIERQEGTSLAISYGHPLSILGTNYLAFLTRKLGGWSFQELNVPLVKLKEYMANGPDLSYDFFTRTETLHALLMGDAALLRQAYTFLLDAEVQPAQLVHDLQNHDEITYQLVPLDFLGEEKLVYKGETIMATHLRERTLQEMRSRAAGEAAPYNLLYRPTRDGLATTYTGFVAAALGVRDLRAITPEQIEQIRRGHLLLAFATAIQPGVFSLSSWDLVGALPLPSESVADLLRDADYRWINRGGVDLLGVNPEAATSRFGLPRARALYGSLPEQLKDPESFASQLKRILAVRKKHRIDEGELIAVPNVSNSALCVLLMRVPGTPVLAITVLNFSRGPVRERIDLSAIPGLPIERIVEQPVYEVMRERTEGRVSQQGIVDCTLDSWSGTLLIVPIRS
ncbi:MAG TPA: maltose alpha-D-glucosyltransferase [Phycisphaerae bacterium]|nr:maltose alpha-D-glucosyltransferase [Phycisphaerae bacterium]